MDKLIGKLKDAGLVDEMGQIILEQCEDYTIAVDVETFKQLFEGSTGSYTNLSNMDDGKGYKKYFDAWKAAGIL